MTVRHFESKFTLPIDAERSSLVILMESAESMVLPVEIGQCVEGSVLLYEILIAVEKIGPVDVESLLILFFFIFFIRYLF